jgi:hypothetical protein
VQNLTMVDSRPVEAFPFAFQPPLDTWARWFAIVPARCFVRLDDHGLEAVYGSWRVATTWANVRSVERTGPYRPWKVAGPVRVSWADRGITMAATTAGGVCLRLHDPVPGVDPLGLFKHPAVTLGVEDVDRFVLQVESHLDRAPVHEDSADPPDHDRGSLGGAVAALLNWRRRSVDVVDRDVDHVDFPTHDRPDDTDEQPPEIAVGPAFHRTYCLDIDGVTRSAEEAMAAIRADPNTLADARFAPFTKTRGRSGEMVVGDRYVIQLAGPWKGAVEVIEVTPRSFRFATLEGHMESGAIEMRAVDTDDGRGVSFTIESWARSHDRVFDVIYDKIGLAQMLQGEMWAIACDRFAEVVAGTPDGPLRIATERQAAGH